MLPPEVRLT